MNITLKWDDDNGKRAFIVAEQNDGWKDVRIELDLDDCDKAFAKLAMQEIIDRVNKANVATKVPFKLNPVNLEWLKKMAEAEDKAGSTSVGGLAVDLGLYKKEEEEKGH